MLFFVLFLLAFPNAPTSAPPPAEPQPPDLTLQYLLHSEYSRGEKDGARRERARIRALLRQGFPAAVRTIDYADDDTIREP